MILGEGLYGGGVVARHAAITAGLSSVPGLAVNRHCAAGQAAVQSAAASIRAGMDQLIIAGGVNSASTSPRFERPQHDGDETVELVPARRTRIGPTRPTWTCRSPSAGTPRSRPACPARRWTSGRSARTARPSQAIDEGRFKEEIVPIETPHGLFDTDEHPRRDTTIEKLAALKPLHPEIEGFSITAGNACGANDGAAVLAIASDRLGLPALATIRSWASVGVDPASTGSRTRRGDPESACPRSAFARRRRPVRDQRGIRVDVRGHHQAARHRSGAASTSAVAAARSVIRSPRQEPGCSSRSCTNCAGAAAESAWRRCAPAAEWDRPRSSRSRLRKLRIDDHRRAHRGGAQRINPSGRPVVEPGREPTPRRGSRRARADIASAALSA